jgi:hypothetical protein
LRAARDDSFVGAYTCAAHKVEGVTDLPELARQSERGRNLSPRFRIG